MLPLTALLDGLSDARVVGDGAREVREVRDDSRQVGPGDLFVALTGTKEDGRRYIDEALAKGATAVLTDAMGADGRAGAVTWIVVGQPRRALGVIAANRHGAARGLCMTAVTGTSGKTTTTYVMESILGAAGRRAGVIGTVTNRFGGREQAAALTTPGALALHGLLAEMKTAGATDVVLEASSHALDQGRLHGCRFRVAALTNVAQDHLDYHQSWDRYFAAKAILFQDLLAANDGVAVLFSDREDGRKMRPLLRGKLLTVATAPGARADVAVGVRRLDGNEIRATITSPVGAIEIASRLVGEHNLANITLAVAMAVGHGIAPEAISRGVAALAGVPGRLERVPNAAGVLCLVDYAHKPDALDSVLAVLRPLTRGRLIVVVGCGGDRDRIKRPIMGETAARKADVTVITSDNPRTERPEAIIGMIVEGVRRTGVFERSAGELRDGECGYAVEPDRRAAIRLAASAARPGDTVLIAGKGHEGYQILGTQKLHFDDREEAKMAFAAVPISDEVPL